MNEKNAVTPQGTEGLVPDAGGTRVSENILLGDDGKYRWVYEVSLWSNPTILFSVWKVFGISIGIIFVFLFFIDLFSGDLDTFFSGILTIPAAFGVIMVLSVIGYAVYAAMMGGKYIVVFEMDEEKIVHIQSDKQFREVKKLAGIAGVIGLVTGNFTLMGQSLNMSSTSSMETSYSAVKSIRSVRKRNVIYVNETLMKNQVYAADADFSFVEDYIRSRCTNAKCS